MIEVTFSRPCTELMKLLELSSEVASCTVNEKDLAFTDRHRSRLVACRWFSEDTIILVDTIVSRKTEEPEGEDTGIIEVMAQLVLDLRPELPAGVITRDMEMEVVLAMVAQSFGVPVRCAKDEPFSTLYTGPGRKEAVMVQTDGWPMDICVTGTFQANNYCEYVWAFEVRRYREWFAMRLPGEKGINQCGTAATWFEHPNASWTTDNCGYVFLPRRGPVGITIQADKQPDGTFVVRIAGPFARQFTFRQSLPPFDPRGVHVAATWKDGSISLYVNGKLTETRRLG